MTSDKQRAGKRLRNPPRSSLISIEHEMKTSYINYAMSRHHRPGHPRCP
ncbi:MAG: hypothetical protein MZV70_14100 [Desulfobacterales bacterium]|nr:hypothetical protein [Desulfobacterales bacterium]